MRGRKPKKRDKYVLRMKDGSLVEVTGEIYREWHQSRRREKYQMEKSRRHGLCSLEAIGGEGAFCRPGGSPEEYAIKKMCLEKLGEALGKLPAEDAYLIRLLFFEEVKAKDAAEICGCCRKTIRNREKRILEELRGMMRESGIVGAT